MKNFIQLSIITAIGILLIGCKSQSVKNETFSEQQIVVESDNQSIKAKLIAEAKTWIGTPYKYGHAQKGEGADCSGFIMTIVDDVAGIKLPRNSAKQSEFCMEIKRTDLKPCDLVFFATGKSTYKISHVGMMIDNDNFIHASSSKGVVISKLSSNYYTSRLIKCCRIPNLSN